MNPPAKLGVAFEPLLARLELAPEYLHRVAGCATADNAASVLESIGALTDAVRVAAHALPRREAVWWACMCARAVPARPQRVEDASAYLQRGMRELYQAIDLDGKMNKMAPFGSETGVEGVCPRCWRNRRPEGG